MKPRRYPLTPSLIISAMLIIGCAFWQNAEAQEKPDEKTAQKKELLTVQPVPAQPDSRSDKDSSPLGNQPAAGQQPKTGNEVLITNTDLITFTVTVTDIYGRFVSGLGKNAFSVLDEKHPQEISFFSDDDAPVSVGVIFDVSGSMSGDKVKRARDALSHFIQTSHDSDEYFLIAFNSRVQLLLDRTRDGNAVLDRLTFVQTKNNTALYDACYLGVERVQRGTHPKRALLLISDGQDNNSRYTFNELRRVLKESDVVVYAIGILSGGDVGSSLGMEGQGSWKNWPASPAARLSSPGPTPRWTTSSSKSRSSSVTNIRSAIAHRIL